MKSRSVTRERRRRLGAPKPPSAQEGFFWKTKTMEEMSNAEWESLCDGCARCCLEKLEDEDTGKIYFTHVSCKLLDSGLCACKDYPNRSDKVPDCVRLTPENVRTLNWLPPSCGYKLVAEGRDLYWWHPLISGDPNTVHEAGVSVRGRVQGTEDEIPDELSRLVDRAERERARLRELRREHRPRPGCPVRRALDLLDRVEVRELEAPELELEHHLRHRSASGART